MSPSNLPSPPLTDVEEQPLARIERDGLHYTLLGTAIGRDPASPTAVFRMEPR